MISNSLSAFRCDALFRASGQIFIIDGVGEASNRSWPALPVHGAGHLIYGVRRMKQRLF
jgi:hypothetical protein